MGLFIKLLLAFTIIPIVELLILIRLAQATDWVTTIAIVIVTGLIGSYLARWQGLQTLRRFQSALGEGRMPAPEIQDGLLIFLAAGLLLTPGLLTDCFGFALLMPPSRGVIRRFLAARLKGKFQVQTVGFGTQPSHSRPVDDTIETTAKKVDES